MMMMGGLIRHRHTNTHNTHAHTGTGICLVDCNDPAQMVKEVGAVAFPAACNVKAEDIGQCVLICMSGTYIYIYINIYKPTHTYTHMRHGTDPQASQAMRRRIRGVIDHHALSEAFSTAGAWVFVLFYVFGVSTVPRRAYTSLNERKPPHYITPFTHKPQTPNRPRHDGHPALGLRLLHRRSHLHPQGYGYYYAPVMMKRTNICTLCFAPQFTPLSFFR